PIRSALRCGAREPGTVGWPAAQCEQGRGEGCEHRDPEEGHRRPSDEQGGDSDREAEQEIPHGWVIGQGCRGLNADRPCMIRGHGYSPWFKGASGGGGVSGQLAVACLLALV